MKKPKWTEEKILEEAKKYSSRQEWKAKSKYSYNLAHKFKIFQKACQHMERQPNIRWTEEMILEDAKKYKTRAEWQKNSKAYMAAVNKNLCSIACAHMKPLVKKWTKKEILEDAKKYQNKAEWIKNSSSYHAAYRQNLIEEATAHMKPIGGTSKSEQDILALVREFYPKAHTLRDRKVNIPDKPHIKGFDIDIYVPELRKGIEFNGKYWHSIQGLKRSRDDWPMEDLESYHLLKKEHFNKKGIEILSIDEKEWLTDSNKCIENIKNFLKINKN